jgi:outer membrane protein assembly factor BamB
MLQTPRHLLSLLALCAISACASTQAFGTTFPDNRPRDVEAVLARLEASTPTDPRAVVVGATAAPSQVFAYDLDAERLLWRQAASVTTAPLAAGDYVVTPEQDALRIRDLETGAVRFEVPSEGMGLMGAGSDGDLTAVVLSTGGSMGARSKLVLVRGGKLTTSAIDYPLGGPAVRAGLVFVPWNRQHLSVLDAEGNELARVRLRDEVVSQALVREGQVYFGDAGLFHFDARSAQGSREGATYFKPSREGRLPGNPAFLPSASTLPPAVESAVQRISLAFHPKLEGDVLGLSDDTLYLAFYRQIYALSPSGPEARWVHQTNEDAVGVEAFDGGLLIADAKGELTALDTQGRVTWQESLGIAPVVARFRVGSFARAPASSEPAPLTVQLMDAALNPDARLVPTRAMAVSLLAALEDEEATQALIEICQDRTTPERVRTVSCVALAKRTNGSDAIIEALARHADYLTATPVPPVGPLSEAALNTKDGRAAPHLLAHLSDPHTPAQELPAVMLALTGLADASAAPAIAAFVRLYHADADDARMQEAIVLGMQALAALWGREASGVLEPIANDSFSAVAVRSEAARLLASLTPPAETADEEPKAAPTVVAPEPEPKGPPEHLTHEHVRKALAPVEQQLSACVRNDPKRPLTARLTIVVDGNNGDVLAVQTLPASLKSCVEPIVLTVPFPATKYAKRETLTHTLTR